MSQLIWLDDSLEFPATENALEDPNGLLAVGGDLRTERLLRAYSRGIFPWYSDDQPILWWSPSPRMILAPEALHIGRSTRKLLKKRPFDIRVDSNFSGVIENCAASAREGQDGTWITQDILSAYERLHDLEHAHSVEAWQGGRLVGGCYGLALGGAFFGESMFSAVSGASKIAFIFLVKALEKWGFQLIDCQVHTEYLESLGAKEVPRLYFEEKLDAAVRGAGPDNWRAAWPFSENDCDC